MARSAWEPAAVFAAVCAFRFLSYTGFPNDHFVHLARAQQMLPGAWPVRDFVDPGFLRARRVGLAGLVAVAALFRPDHGVVLGLVALVAILWADARSAAARAKTAFGFGATTAAFLVPWMVFVQSTTGLAAYARSVIGFTSTKQRWAAWGGRPSE